MKLNTIVSGRKLLFGMALVAVFLIGIGNNQVCIAQENSETISQSPGDEKISWESSIDLAAEKATKKGKLVLVDVYKDRCGWCQALDQKVFQDPQVASFINQNFVCLKSNAEVGEGVKVVRLFEVYSFPSTLVLTSSGVKVGKIVGFMPPKKFTKKLSKLIKKSKRSKYRKKR